MTTTISNITFGNISNVRKSGDEESVYLVDIEISEAEGFPLEVCIYCARSDDRATTGKWVYAQILAGNFSGEIIQRAAGTDIVTGETIVVQAQPQSHGTQTL